LSWKKEENIFHQRTTIPAKYEINVMFFTIIYLEKNTSGLVLVLPSWLGLFFIKECAPTYNSVWKVLFFIKN